jgi:hypothetical protein
MKTVRVLLMFGLWLAATSGWSKTVGVWQVAPRYVTEAMVKTLEEGGWRVVILAGTNLADAAALDGVDVVFVPGGWDAYHLAGFKARRNLVRFVAGGKGLLDGAASIAQPPLFPEIGKTIGRRNGARIVPVGESGLAKTREPFLIYTNAPLMELQAGPEGKAFAASGTNVIGLCGQPHAGRYILFGGSFTHMEIQDEAEREKAGRKVLLTESETKALMEKSTRPEQAPEADDLLGDDEGADASRQKGPPARAASGEAKAQKRTPGQQILLACLDWLASAPVLSAAERNRHQAQADLEFLRCEKRADWTDHESRWLTHLSIVPEVRVRQSLLLERRRFAAQELTRSLTGNSLDRCRALTNEIALAIARLDLRYEEIRSNTQVRIRQMEIAELTEDNPFVDAPGVLKRIAATPGKTDAQRAEMIALVNRCSSLDPPVDVPRRVALYRCEGRIAEEMVSGIGLSEATGRWDRAIAELRAAIPRSTMAATVPERLRIDPLMAPYYTGNIIPTPQEAEYRDEFIPMANVAIVFGKDVENPDALAEALVDRIARYGGRAAVVAAPSADHTAVLSLGDTELARQAKDVPSVPAKDEGYVLAHGTAGDKPLVILKGRDRLGLLWAVASEIQLIHWKDGKTLSRVATVADYPILKRRGAILTGHDFFYPAKDRNGRILSYPDTDLLLRQNRLLILISKINEPCYQHLIAADCYSRDWKEPDLMPADAHIEEDLAALGKTLTPLGIAWWAGIRPHAAGDSTPEELSHKLCADEQSVEGLLYYARKTEEAGGHLSILLDDIRFPITLYDQERLGTAREVDTWVLTNVMARVKKEYPKARLLVCPPFYWGPVGRGWVAYGEDRDAYLRTIGNRWPPEIEVFWSGRQVNATTLAVKEHFEWWMGLTKRKPYFWQNCAAYWCHLYRRHYPTDALNSLCSSYWEGQFDVLGWYGFNGGDIPRYAITDTISADFQWNPQAYCKEKYVSTERSVKEIANKFVGTDGWEMMCKVTGPLSYFDGFIPPDNLRGREHVAAADALNKTAARHYDIMESKRDAVVSAFKAVQEAYPASIQAWTSLGSFIGVANMIDGIKADPALALYRAAVQQGAEAKQKGAYDPSNDIFLAAADFSGGALKELAEDPLDGKRRQAAQVAEGVRRNLKAEFKPEKDQRVGPYYDLVVCGRQSRTTGRMTLTLNGKPFFEKPAPFSETEASVARFPIPDGLLNETNNVLEIGLGSDESPLAGDTDDTGMGESPPLAVHYAILKYRVSSSK